MLPEPLLSFADAKIDAELSAYLTAMERYQAQLNLGLLLPGTYDALRVELTYHSNAIEGSTLSLRDTQLILEGREPNTGKSLREIYEARNHDRAFRRIESWAKSRAAGWRLTETDLLAIHSDVLADISPEAGSYRQGRVLITGTRFVPPSPQKFPGLIDALFGEPVKRMPPILQAAEFHYNLVAIHPFVDGNGRTARLCMNAVVLAYGLPMIVIAVEDRAEYLSALDEANEGRVTAFASFVTRSATATIARLCGD
ncbi:MAG: Fic family protein [Fimbriiglobus sp.]